MRKVVLMRKTGLRRGKSPNLMSVRKIRELWCELPERKALAERCGGELRIEIKVYRRNDGREYDYPSYRCVNGICECGCGQFGEYLQPHEYKVLRSHGGKVHRDNTIMVRPDCHVVKQAEAGKGEG